MNSSLYLLSRKLKNRIKEIFHRPSETIMLFVFVALIGFTVFSGNLSSGEIYAQRSMDEFYAIVLALYALIFFITAKSGFVNGASMFSMADVNLIFTSPKKQTRVLTYGLLSQLGRSLLLGLFILYQYSWAHDSYGISYFALIAVLVGYAITVFLSQMLAMLIYSVTAGDDKKNNVIKGVFYAVIAAFLLWLGFNAYSSDGDLLSNVVTAANSLVMKFFPVAGFVQLGVIGAVSGKYTYLLISLACFAAFIALYFVLISVINADYYEDVLKATEVSFSAITARKEGKAVENAPRNVKVGKVGFNKGEGASAIFEKHKIENRRSKFLLLDITAVITAIITIAVGYFTRDIFAALIGNIYITLLTVGAGRWAKELHLPFVYLIPEPPFKKLLYMLREQLPYLIAEGVVTFVPLYFLLNINIPQTVALVVLKVSFGYLFIGVNLLFERLLGNSGSKRLMIIIYFLSAMIFSVPCFTVYAVMSSLYVSLAVTFVVMAAVNAAEALILIFACRNILEYAEYNNK